MPSLPATTYTLKDLERQKRHTMTSKPQALQMHWSCGLFTQVLVLHPSWQI